MQPYFIDHAGVKRTKQDVLNLITEYERRMDQNGVININETGGKIIMNINFYYYQTIEFNNWREVWEFMLVFYGNELHPKNLPDFVTSPINLSQHPSKVFDYTDNNAGMIENITVEGLRKSLIEDMGLGMF